MQTRIWSCPVELLNMCYIYDSYLMTVKQKYISKPKTMKANIEQIIEAFIKWYKNDIHSTNEDAYPELKTSEFIKGLDREEFIEYFLKFKRDGGKIQSGGARRATFFRKTLEDNYAKFREFVLKPYDRNFNVYDWLEKVYEFQDFGKGGSTIFLNRIDKNRFAIVNNKSNEALKIMGYNIPNDFISAYHSIIDSQKDLIKKFPVISNFYIADALNHFLIGTEEGKKYIPELQTDLRTVSEPEIDLRKNYWIFQCNPDQYDIVNEWQSITEETWKVSAHKTLIKSGDRVILWVTGKKSGCYGLCTVKSEVLKDNDSDYVEMDIDYNLVNQPLEKEVLLHLPEFIDFKGGYRGTNFLATKEQYDKILEMISDLGKHFPEKKVLVPKLINLPLNLILYGPPGTGKTYELINNYINFFIDKNGEKKTKQRYEMITFHQSYSYEEFIEGIRPSFDDDDELKYKIEPGIFLQIAEKAREDKANPYAIFIDEINRGNISKIFGELITLIEPDKRQGAKHEIEVVLPYSKSKFSVPSNLYIIGTMNTADRSIALIDTALRRRFCFREMLPNTGLLSIDVDGINLQFLLSKMNERIEFLLDRDHCLGHSFFMQVKSKKEICEVFKQKIIPLLQEYFYNDWEKLQLVLGDNKSWGKKEEHKLVQVKKHYDLAAEKELFGSELDDFEDEIIYEINPELDYENSDLIPVESFIHIYQKPVKSIV